jgi:hypothetical protein
VESGEYGNKEEFDQIAQPTRKQVPSAPSIVIEASEGTETEEADVLDSQYRDSISPG